MSSSRRLLALTLGSVAFLSGCARDTRDYPSLAPRAVEQRGFAEPQAKPEPVQADPALDERITEMGQSLSNLAAAFDQNRSRSRRRRSARPWTGGRQRRLARRTGTDLQNSTTTVPRHPRSSPISIR